MPSALELPAHSWGAGGLDSRCAPALSLRPQVHMLTGLPALLLPLSLPLPFPLLVSPLFFLFCILTAACY